MATIVEELIGLVGLEIDEGSFRRGANALENIGRQYERVAQSAKSLAVAALGVGAFTAITNKMTAEQARMAEAVGISTTALNAFADVAQQGGLNLDTVVDLVEELNNKLGESKGVEEMKAVTEATKILGLEFKTLQNLNPEEQFIRVLEAAQALEDQQAAVSAADILLGGDANKFIGLLRTQDKGVRQLIDDYERLNLLTEEGVKEAKEFNKTFAGTVKIFKTAGQQLAALLGRFIEPMLKAFNDWIADNKDLAQSLINVFSIVLPTVLGIAGVAVAALTARLIAMGIVFAVHPAVLWAAGLLVAGAAIALVVEDIVTFIKHGNDAATMTGRLVTWLKNLALAARVNVGMAFDFVNDKIQAVINKVKELIGFVTNSSAVQWVVGQFSDDDATAVPTVGAGAGGGSSSNTTVNNASTNTSSNVIYLTANNIPDIQKVLEDAMATSARANSTGVLR